MIMTGAGQWPEECWEMQCRSMGDRDKRDTAMVSGPQQHIDSGPLSFIKLLESSKTSILIQPTTPYFCAPAYE